MLAGWDEGVVTMKVGEKATLDISRYVLTHTNTETNSSVMVLTHLASIVTLVTVPRKFDWFLKRRRNKSLRDRVRLENPLFRQCRGTPWSYSLTGFSATGLYSINLHTAHTNANIHSGFHGVIPANADLIL